METVAAAVARILRAPLTTCDPETGHEVELNDQTTFWSGLDAPANVVETLEAAGLLTRSPEGEWVRSWPPSS